MLATAVAVTRVELPGVRMVWLMSMAAAVATPFVTVVAYISNAVALVNSGPSTGQAILTALSLLALAAATLALRPDRQPVAWLLARTDRWTLVRLLGVLAGLPIMVGVARWVLLAVGMGEDPSWALAMAVGSFVAGTLTFYWSQREQSLLIDKEVLSRQRAEAEMRYRVIADNAVDIVVHFRGSHVGWVSPSVETGLGWLPEQWVGSDLRSLIHPDDLEALLTALRIAVPGEAGLERFRIRADGDYHWVEGHGKPYRDGEGNTDGIIAALRIIDDQVLAEQLLEQMAKFDHLTGLTNSAETLVRLQRELECLRDPGPHLGVLVCDVDDFKAVNDTWGHKIGDAVLATLATRIRQCIRAGDTAGRMGGDEFLVLLPGLHDIEEAVQIGDKIRLLVAEPILALGMNIYTTVSIGAAVAFPGELPDAIIARADAAMYRAKHAGKDAVIHT